MEPVTLPVIDHDTLVRLAMEPIGTATFVGDSATYSGLVRLTEDGQNIEYLPLRPHIQAFVALGGPLTSGRMMGHLVAVLFAHIKPYVPANELVTSSLARAIERESEYGL